MIARLLVDIVDVPASLYAPAGTVVDLLDTIGTSDKLTGYVAVEENDETDTWFSVSIDQIEILPEA
jgi:hypothetical protein